MHRLVADLHLHSRFSMATSPRLNIESLAETAVIKGIDLMAAPDAAPITAEDLPGYGNSLFGRHAIGERLEGILQRVDARATMRRINLKPRVSNKAPMWPPSTSASTITTTIP